MILAALALAAAQPAEGPRAFISRLYSEYGKDGFSPLAEPQLYFAPGLVAEIRKDGADGEVGYLDGDPLCDCQDYDHLTASVLKVRQPSANAAIADVRVTIMPGTVRKLELRLARGGSGWRVADIVGADHHSLLSELKRANAEKK